VRCGPQPCTFPKPVSAAPSGTLHQNVASLQRKLLGSACAVASAVLLSGAAGAATDKVAEFATSGFLFKDTVQVMGGHFVWGRHGRCYQLAAGGYECNYPCPCHAQRVATGCVQVVKLEDPAVEGINIYITEYKRSLTEKLSNVSEQLATAPCQWMQVTSSSHNTLPSPCT
jgi:hypothetical protein